MKFAFMLATLFTTSVFSQNYKCELVDETDWIVNIDSAGAHFFDNDSWTDMPIKYKDANVIYFYEEIPSIPEQPVAFEFHYNSKDINQFGVIYLLGEEPSEHEMICIPVK